MIGLYGPIFFHSGSTGLTTFDEMKKTVTARWGEHPIHMQKPLLEYSGAQLIEIGFRMELIKPFTMDPLAAIVTLQEIMDLAIPLPLIIGMFPMGRGMSLFVLTSLSHEMKYFYRGGGLLGASVEVQLKEYPVSLLSLLSSLTQALGGAGAAPQAATTATDANVGPAPSNLVNTENQGFEGEYANTNQSFEAADYPAATTPTVAQNSFVPSQFQGAAQPNWPTPPQPPPTGTGSFSFGTTSTDHAF